MRVTRRTLKKIATISTAVAIVILAISAVFYITSPDFDYFIVVAFTVAVAPVSLAGLVHGAWKAKIERAMPEFLRDLATSIQTGVPVFASLEHASKKEYGPLKDELQILVSQMSWGMNLNDALAELSKRVDLPLFKKATVLISEASTYGGDLSEIFNATARYVENVNTWGLRRRMQTLPYVGIFYFSIVLFLFIIILLSTIIFIPMGELSQSGIPFMRPVLDPVQARRVFMHASLLESFFGGILAGKITDDSYVGGLKHSMILALISGIAFFLFFR
jgi:flagellar protein FlaJ